MGVVNRLPTIPWKTVAGYIALVLIFGSGWAAISIGVREVAPFVFGAYRAVLSSLILTGLVLVRRLPWPTDRSTILAAIVSTVLFYGVGTGVVYWSERYLPSGVVSVFGSSAVIWTAVLAHFMVRGDSMTVFKALGLIIGVAGIIVLRGFQTTGLQPEAYVALGLLTLWPVGIAIAIIIQVRALGLGSPLPLIAIGSWGVSVVVVLLALTERAAPQHWSATALIALVYLAVFTGALGQLLQLWLTRKIRATTNAFVQVLVPLVALLIGTIGLGEMITPRIWLGVVLVLGAVGLTVAAGRAPRPVSTP